MGGKLTLSDDSHGVAQVGLNFKRTINYLREIGVKELYYPKRSTQDADRNGYSPDNLASLPLEELLVNDYPTT